MATCDGHPGGSLFFKSLFAERQGILKTLCSRMSNTVAFGPQMHIAPTSAVSDSHTHEEVLLEVSWEALLDNRDGLDRIELNRTEWSRLE